MDKIWKKQPYESKISFGHFQKYYLLQPSPRTLTKAYRKFQIEKGVKTPQQIKKSHASGSWNNWANGKDSNGEVLAGSYTWAERAEAYDSNVFQLKEKDYLEARRKLLEKEIGDAENQLQLWDELSDSLAQHARKLIKTAKETGETYNPSPLVNKAKEFWKWREEIATFQRRSINMPAVIKDIPEKNSDDESATKIEWDEPLGDDDEIGVGKEELKEPHNNVEVTKQE